MVASILLDRNGLHGLVALVQILAPALCLPKRIALPIISLSGNAKTTARRASTSRTD
jgi:hypothetical protein